MPRASKVKTSWKRKKIRKKATVKRLANAKVGHRKPQGLSEIAHWVEPTNSKTIREDLQHYRDYYCDHRLEVVGVVRTATQEKKVARCMKGCGYMKTITKPL